jgi:predicted amidohydrolase
MLWQYITLIYRESPIFFMLAACLQLQIQLCRREVNLEKALEMAGLALQQGAEILVFPELFLTGFCYEPQGDDYPPYPTLDPFRDLSREHGCMIIGSLKSGRYNLGFVLEGERSEFRPKIHPFGEEEEHFDGGERVSPVLTSIGGVGLEICYDLRFPEVARSLSLQGADILVTVAQFPHARRDQWRILCLARAIENQLPHLACNCAGSPFAGSSMIIDARGRALAEAGQEEALLLGQIDLAERDQFQREITCAKDRRPGAYGPGAYGDLR